jgi:hypothetical protein
LVRTSLHRLTDAIDQGKTKILTTVAEIDEAVVHTYAIRGTLIRIFEQSNGGFFTFNSFALSVDKSKTKRSLTFSKICASC